ncbi:hypothetical protein VNI00_002125 [Paramarasmius palmivorus]|uniref:F-box domain-containing protein n=1 Tax=Paramarasmius palmivorus TaxID=297713 RepID=A0AAW0E0K8_9AGAR
MLLCPKCDTPFLADDTSWQPHHPRVDMQALRSNVLPSPQVISQMNALARAEKSDMEDMEETIQRVQDTLKELRNRRDTLRQEIQRRKSWLAPVRRLPVEVLQEVFANICLGNGRTGFSLDISSEVEEAYCGSCESPECRHCGPPKLWKHTITTPFSLSRVCSRWRGVAIGTPSLWASLSLDVRGMGKKHGYADLVDLYLRRSIQYPLKIALVHGDGYDIGEVGCDVLRSVVQELYRCREFHYQADTYDLLDLVHEAFRPRALPLLTTFDEQVVTDVGADDKWLWELVKVAPKLVDMTVERFIRPDSFHKNLRSLTFRGRRDCIGFLQTIPQLPNLVSLNLDFPFHENVHGTPPSSLPTPYPIHIRNLKITAWEFSKSMLNLLFSSVTFPSLSSLEIYVQREYANSTNDLGPLFTLVRGSGCSLRKLTLHVGSFSSGALISLLELQPSLVGLNINGHILGKWEPLVLVDLFARMADPQLPLIPCIQRLNIHDKATSDEKFTEIAASVLDMVALREFVPDISLTFNKGYDGKYKGHGLPVDLEKRAKELNERGVECRIVFPWEVRIRRWHKGDTERNSRHIGL